MAKFIYYSLVLLVCYFIVFIALVLFQRHLLYHPSPLRIEQHPLLKQSATTVYLHTKDNLTLSALYYPAKAQRPTFIALMGNAGVLGHLNTTQARLLRDGYGLLQVGYRGFSGNPGKPTEQGLYEDARAGLRFLNRQGIDNQNIIVWGESLGAAVAVHCASEFSVRALILQAPFYRLADVARYHYPYIPGAWFLVDKYESNTKIHRINTPLFIVHGAADTLIPVAMGKALFDAAREPKQWLQLQAGHNNLPDYSDALIQFITRNNPPSDP